ncbi:hypothetical protein AAF712_002806 [Marasmius tenuissimus]|uniref:Uncharacterized protein n=1 Tax=Marasmius tenuissimus TaxID=585030 RepID=A0ABR3A7M5_9AGAR
MVQHRVGRRAERSQPHRPGNHKQLPEAHISSHHQFPRDQNLPVELDNIVKMSKADIALQGFQAKLYQHLISHILDVDPASIPDNELYRLHFDGDRFYKHSRFRVHYTSYDCRRKQETIGFRRRPHIMMLGDSDDSHPYLYARVIGIYHANVLYVGGTNPTKHRMCRMEFLFVRWFKFEEGYTWGWKMKRLPKVRFLDVKDPEAFGFVDPACVIRCSHVIPAFEWNDTTKLLPSNSSAHKYEEFHEGQYVKDEEDFLYYFINIHVHALPWQRENDIPIPSYDENGDLEAHSDDDDKGMGNSEVASELDEESDEESDEEDLVEEETRDEMMTGWKFTYMDDDDKGIVDDGADDENIVDYEAESHGEDSGDKYD